MALMQSSRIHIGTSGWHYKHWCSVFYPENLPTDKWLDYYSGRFHTVEINNSFYRLPEISTLSAWRRIQSAEFVFALKASRTITHMKKLKNAKQPLERFVERARRLGGKLGPILFQLPPRWRLNTERLEGFLALLPKDLRFVFEFRDDDWHNPATYRLLSRFGAAFCIYQLAGRYSPVQVTADFVYIRLHGPLIEPYRGSYDTQTLAGWAGAFSTWTDQGLDVFCYFDNDEAGYAVQNALQLQGMIHADTKKPFF